MNWYKNLKVKTKMITGFLVVVALLVALAVLSVIEMNSISTSYKYAIESPMEAELQMHIFEQSTIDLRRLTATAAVFASVDPSRVSSYEAEIAPIRAYGMEALNIYRNLLEAGTTMDPNARRSALQTVDELVTLYNRYIDECTMGVLEEGARGDIGNMMGYVALSVGIGEEISTIVAGLIDTAAKSADSNIAYAEATAATMVVVLIAVAAAAAVIAMVIALYISGLIASPLKVLSGYMDDAGSRGILEMTPEEKRLIPIYSKYKDEIGGAFVAAQKFFDHVIHISSELEKVSSGDLTVEIEVLSEEDVLGNSLQKMTDNLNDIFGNINSATSQVSTGAKQVADGAQSLAQGSTEQAASIEELSASIGEIAGKTKENADMAERAAALAGSIMQNAEKGSRQMDDMMNAVNEINEASQSIGKVIKTIDDIAFQTNILALNAAVEAARAGQHGKGFAVVAEEVRNLAAKSADAAKETGDMIQNSMEKAELGSRIAGETAGSLTEIVSGITESSALIGDIARSSDEQSAGISQINTGIDQVAQVVQQNSATAQESAAASQQMSGQSDMLKDLVEQFKLKDSGSASMRLPSAGKGSRSAEPADEPGVNGPGAPSGDFGKY